MSCQKRKAEKEEKEIGSPNSAKRACFHQNVNSPNKRGCEQTSSKNARRYSDQERKRILGILEAEFDKELQAKEDEVIEIQERILKTQKILQYLCYAVVSDFYSREKTITSVASTRQRRIHPAVKKLLSGKGPPGAPEVPQNVTIPAASSSGNSSSSDIKDNDILDRGDSPISSESVSGKEKKVPRYIPPKPKPKPIVGNQSEPIRGGQNKVKTILVVGNVSKWLPQDMRDDSASHKWMVYVRGPKGNPDISSFVSKVRFFLHPSYRPNDVVQVVCPPFQLSRRGWGEFPIRVQVHFSNSLNKPVDIIHNLKLDRTHCGLQTLGSETVAEVWIHRDQPMEMTSDDQQVVKAEPVDIDEGCFTIPNEETISFNASLNTESVPISLKTVTEKTATETSTDTSISENLLQSNRQIVSSQSPDLDLHQDSEQNSAPSDLIVSKVKAEISLESGHHPVTSPTVPELSESELKQRKHVLPSVVFSPTKALQSESSPLEQSPIKSNVVAPPQQIQVSPAKPGTQIVKCVDSKGTVRLLQVRSDLLPKILKRGSTTIPATPPAAPEGLTKVTVSSSAVQTSVPKVLPHAPAIKVVPQTAVTPALSQNVVAKVVPQTSVAQVLQHSAVTQVPLQTAATQVLQHTAVTQVPLQTAAKQVLQQTAVTQVPLQTAATQVPHQTITSKIALNSPVKLQGLQAAKPLMPGARPLLRFVRPAGNATARPLLVAANTTNQQIIRLPASAASHGNQPLYVLKDGKLFMMKSALDAAAAGSMNTSSPVINPTVSTSSSAPVKVTSATQKVCESVSTISSVALKTAVSKPLGPSSTTAIASVVHAKAANTLTPTNSDVNRRFDSIAATTTIRNMHPALVEKPGILLKPRSSISIPPVVRFSSPRPVLSGDQEAHTANKNNVMPMQGFTQPQNMLNSIPRIAVKPGKSLLKPAVSLLKTNTAASIPANKSVHLLSASSSPLPSIRPPISNSSVAALLPLVSTEAVATNKRIILGRHSGSSSITPYSQQAIFYRELLKSAVRACPQGPDVDVQRAVRWLVKNVPLINPEAKHLEYKIFHPYCAPSENVFCSWNIGKQRACEWQRAKTVHCLLKESGWDLQNVWSIRQIVLWARFHGFTPGLPLMKDIQLTSSPCGGDCENPIASVCEFGKSLTVDEWLSAQEKPSYSLSSVSHGLHSVESSDESDEEVDVISSTSPSRVRVKQEPTNISVKDISEEMHLEPSLHPLADLVKRSLNNMGLKLSSEEIAPGVCYPAAERMLIQAAKSFIEDITRRAFANGWGKDNITRRPESIETSNVCGAICHRPEFDIFTCTGLGIASISDSTSSTSK